MYTFSKYNKNNTNRTFDSTSFFNYHPNEKYAQKCTQLIFFKHILYKETIHFVATLIGFTGILNTVYCLISYQENRIKQRLF